MATSINKDKTLITYIIGAGASKNAHPIVSEFPKNLEEFERGISKIAYVNDGVTSGVLRGDLLATQRLLIEDIKWLRTELSQFASIDTFAKTLFVTKNFSDLDRLKLVTSLFFNYRELSGSRDYRYNSFFASIIQEEWQQLPSNIRIVTWNYDHQFEHAFTKFSRSTPDESRGHLRIVDRFTTGSPTAAFTIFKINGSASIGLGVDDFVSPTKLWGNGDTNHDLLTKYKICRDALYPTPGVDKVNPPVCRMCYAWEKHGSNLDLIKEAILGTTVLVVLGYSFPFFNRSVDSALLAGMNPTSVYIQDPFHDGPRERLEVLKPTWKDRIIIKKETEQFLIPNELD